MSLKNALELESFFLKELADLKGLGAASGQSPISDAEWRLLIEAQFKSRVGDLCARELRAENIGFYTISSAGHENNSVLASHLKDSDPSLLHYRSGGFMMRRSAFNKICPLKQMVWSCRAASSEAVSGGRHKVWGDNENWVIPQTSTIASHLPKSVGLAFAIDRRKMIDENFEGGPSEDAIVLCSFGDASSNHASAQTAFNTADWVAYQKLPVPIVFLCEDNGFGISVRSPSGWVKRKFLSHPGIKYFGADGLDIEASYIAARDAVNYCRESRKPVFLHLGVVRLLGHAGSDVETTYRSIEEIRNDFKKDPLLLNCKRAVERLIFSPDELKRLWSDIREAGRLYCDEVKKEAGISSREEVVSALVSTKKERSYFSSYELPAKDLRLKVYKNEKSLPENLGERQMSMLLNWALHDEMLKDGKMLIFGEDVAKKGGVYGLTRNLYNHFGVKRVFNSLLDETSILGMAIGAAQAGFLPCPEMQYLAYYHNAQDQIRSEAASQSFFSNGFWTNPMVVRIASFAYQKGFGGHFHNDNSLAVLRDIPGAVIAAPSRGDDAVRMLRTCFEIARAEKRVVFFLEPIALYNQKDLYEDGDKKWLFEYPADSEGMEPGSPRTYFEQHKDVLIISYANGVTLSLRAARKVLATHGIRCRILDLRWLLPLNHELILQESEKADTILVVDECRETGNINEEILSLLKSSGNTKKSSRVCAENTYLPLGPATDFVLPTEEQIYEEIIKLKEKGD